MNMANILDLIYKIRFLDELAEKKTWAHDIHPFCKLLVTVAYLFTVISFGKYELTGLLPFVFYPVVIFASGELPARPVLKRTLMVAPFVLGIGIFNPFLDRSTAITLFGFSITKGWISFFSLLLKCWLTALAALLLLATTRMEQIALALRMLRVPKILVLQLLLTYRYMTVFAKEVSRISSAYLLRAPGQKGVHMKVWGSLTGTMLLRTLDRAQRVYQAMKLRGFEGEYNTGRVLKPGWTDLLYLASWMTFFAFARAYNLPVLIGAAFVEVMK